MKKKIIIIVVVVGIATLCIITCPDKQAHVDGLNSIVKETMYKRSQENLSKDLDRINREEEEYYNNKEERSHSSSEFSVGFEYNPNGARRSFEMKRQVAHWMYDGPIESTKAELFIQKHLDFQNRFVFSTGYMEDEAGRYIVSFGVFGHIFHSKDLRHWSSIMDYYRESPVIDYLFKE